MLIPRTAVYHAVSDLTYLLRSTRKRIYGEYQSRRQHEPNCKNCLRRRLDRYQILQAPAAHRRQAHGLCNTMLCFRSRNPPKACPGAFTRHVDRISLCTSPLLEDLPCMLRSRAHSIKPIPTAGTTDCTIPLRNPFEFAIACKKVRCRDNPGAVLFASPTKGTAGANE